jgi:dsRNA-specific ribonuclease
MMGIVPLSSKSNERLEFIGDGVLECVTKFYLYRRFPLENEGFMTEKKIALVKNEAIGKVALEMGLEKWFILSKQTEEKQIRYNLKKLGCLFEALLGSIFLDFNETDYIHQDKSFLSGPGFQVAQLFIESIFEKHIDWTNLIQNDDNYKNILQVKIQREFKVTPIYIEMIPYNHITGYTMGVYLCLGQSIHTVHHSDALHLDSFESLQEIRDYVAKYGKILLFLGEGSHRIKKKAEQIASLHFGEKKQFFT